MLMLVLIYLELSGLILSIFIKDLSTIFIHYTCTSSLNAFIENYKPPDRYR